MQSSSEHITVLEAMYLRTGILDARAAPTIERGNLAEETVSARLRAHLGYAGGPACLPCRDLARRLTAAREESRGKSLTLYQSKSTGSFPWRSLAAALVFLPFAYFYSGHIFAQGGVHAWSGLAPIPEGGIVTAGDSGRKIVLISGFIYRTGELELAPGSTVQWNEAGETPEWELLEGGMEVRLETGDAEPETVIVRAGELTAEPSAENDGEFVLQISIEPVNILETEVTEGDTESDREGETIPAVVSMTVIEGEAVYSEPGDATILLDSGESARVETETGAGSP